MNHTVNNIAILVLALAAAGCELLGDTSLPDYGQIEEISYARHVQVLFEQRCTTCHNGAEAAPDLRSWEAMVDGSPAGGVVVPYDASRSRMVRMLTERSGDVHPADVGQDTVPEVEVAFLRRWIEAGARNDDDRVPYADAQATAVASVQGAGYLAVIDVVRGAVARVIDLETLGFAPGGQPGDLTSATDAGRWFVSIPSEEAVLAFDTTYALVGLYEVPQAGRLAVSADGAWLVVGQPAGSTAGRVHVVETRDSRVRARESVFPETFGVGIQLAGDVAYAASRSADQIVIMPTASASLTYEGLSGPRHGVVRLVTASPDRLVALGGTSGQAIVLEVSAPLSPVQIGSISFGSGLVDGVASGESLTVLVADGRVIRSDLSSGGLVTMGTVANGTGVDVAAGLVVVAASQYEPAQRFEGVNEYGAVHVLESDGSIRASIELDGRPAAVRTVFERAPTS